MAIHIVQYQPEIALNTGSIMRTCLGINGKIHLIKPMGFEFTEQSIKRYGANYVHQVDYAVHENWEAFLGTVDSQKLYFLSQHGKKFHTDIDFSEPLEDYYVVVGRESTGFPDELLESHLDRCFRVPMSESTESLNVSNVVAVIAYEAMRQQNFIGLK